LGWEIEKKQLLSQGEDWPETLSVGLSSYEKFQIIRRQTMLTIKILGPGCANCKRVEQIARKVITDLALEANIIKVTNYPDIMQYPILSTPGLVINEQVVCSGRIPTRPEVTTWIANALEIMA
jgi:small redox-active disulfide protein 2